MTAVPKIVPEGDREQGPGPRIGLALGSGSARGWAHIGVIEALAEEGIRPDVVCGTSIGALVGAAYATGRLDRLEAWARRISWLEVTRLIDLKMAGGGLVEGHRMMRFLRKLQGDPQIQTLDAAFAAVAADLVTGHEIWLREGSIIDAVRASMALPGILSPVQRGGHRLVDGGLVNPVPVAPCRALGAELIIAVNLNGELVGRRVERKARSRSRSRAKTAAKSRGGSRKTRALRTEIMERLGRELPGALGGGATLLAGQFIGDGTGGPGYFDVIFGSINIMQDRITRSRMAGDPPDVLLSPSLRQIGLLEFNRADEAIEAGRVAVRQMLPALRQALEAQADEAQAEDRP